MEKVYLLRREFSLPLSLMGVLFLSFDTCFYSCARSGSDEIKQPKSNVSRLKAFREISIPVWLWKMGDLW